MDNFFGLPPVRRVSEGLVIALVLLAVGLRSLSAEGLAIYDELGSLRRGLAILDGNPVPLDNSPIHGLLYAFLALLMSPLDPLEVFLPDLYLAGRATSAVLVSIGVWTALRITTGSVSAFLGLLLIGLSEFTYVWPGPFTVPAFIIVLSLAFLVLRPKSSWSHLFAVSGAWVIAGARPEFVPFAAGVGLYFLIVTVRRFVRETRPQMVIPAVLSLLPPAFLFASFGLPGSTGRGLVAIVQHYALRNVPPGVNPWTEGGQYFRQDFPTAETPIAMLQENPLAFAEHTLANALEIVPRLLWSGFVATSKNPSEFLASPEVLGTLTGAVGLGLIFFFTYKLVARMKHLGIRALRSSVADKSFLAAYLTLLIGTSLATSMVLYPRAHYLLPLFVILVFGAIRTLHVLDYSPLPCLTPKILLGLMVFAAIYSAPYVASGLQERPGGYHLVTEVQSIDPDSPVIQNTIIEQFLPDVGAKNQQAELELNEMEEEERERFLTEESGLVDESSVIHYLPSVTDPKSFLEEAGFVPLQSDPQVWAPL